jgi:hypothetical protein
MMDPVSPDASGGRRRGRLRRALIMLSLVGVATAGVAVGAQQRQTAALWQDRATILEQQRDDAIGRSEALGAQLDELGMLAQLSAEDLAAVEERLAELAGEKAQAEDRATLTREELRTLASRVDTSFRLLNACVDELFVLQNDTVLAFNQVARGGSPDIEALNARLQATRERCTTARQAGADAVALASRLR